jgi:hypothetical protein
MPDLATIRAKFAQRQEDDINLFYSLIEALEVEVERLTEALRDANVALVRIKLAVDDARTRTLAALAAAEEGGERGE